MANHSRFSSCKSNYNHLFFFCFLLSTIYPVILSKFFLFLRDLRFFVVKYFLYFILFLITIFSASLCVLRGLILSFIYFLNQCNPSPLYYKFINLRPSASIGGFDYSRCLVVITSFRLRLHYNTPLRSFNNIPFFLPPRHEGTKKIMRFFSFLLCFFVAKYFLRFLGNFVSSWQKKGNIIERTKWGVIMQS